MWSRALCHLLFIALSSLAGTLAMHSVMSGYRIFGKSRGSRLFWHWIGASAMGIVIWSLHFTVILVWNAQVNTHYDILKAVMSMAIAVLAFYVEISTASRPDAIHRGPHAGTVVLGIGIAAMHETAVAATDTGGMLHGDAVFQVSSLLVAYLSSAMALLIRRRLAVYKINLLNQATIESESTYKLILEQMTDIIGILNKDGELIYVSPSWEALLGEQKDELLFRNPIEWLHPSDRDTVMQAIQNTIEGMRTTTIEVRLRRSDGAYVDVDVKAIPIVQNEQVVQIVFTGREIGDRKKAEEMMMKTERLSVAGQLAAGIAHELRNPLTAVRGFIQLLEPKAPDSGEYFRIIYSELNRIQSIMQEFLMLTRPTELNVNRVNLIVVLEDVIHLIQPQAMLSNVEIQFDRAVTSMMAECDENRMKQVFINLIKNAIEAMPNGGRITVSVSALQDGFVRIRIADTGSGIPPSVIEKLGEPFYTTKDKGTGLGLAICNKIVQEHRGWLEIHSTEGEGTIIDVILPIHSELVQVM
jgi:PAS domain S-box-containing protein